MALNDSSSSAIEAAIRTIITWLGDDPLRPGLAHTPARVAQMLRSRFAGYGVELASLLEETLPLEPDAQGHPILLRDIPFCSYCEHHMLPMIGRVHIEYVPDQQMVGIGKLVRLVQAYAERLQIQERLTGQIATALHTALRPLGVAVCVDAAHYCTMWEKGAVSPNSTLRTMHYTGLYAPYDAPLRQAFLSSFALRPSACQL